MENFWGVPVDNMQFDCLKSDPVWHDNLKKGQPSRFMRYETQTTENPDLDKKYPTFKTIFQKMEDICSEYLYCESQIRCQYVCAGRNFLINIGDVKEQKVHTDYDPTRKVVS